MASDEVDIAVGLSIAGFPTVLASRQIVDYTLPACLVDIINKSHQGTTGNHTKMAADLKDGGQLELTVHHFQDYDYWAEVGTEGTCTVTLPSGATLAFTAVYESYTPQNAPLNGKMVADAVLTVSSNVIVTAAA